MIRPFPALAPVFSQYFTTAFIGAEQLLPREKQFIRNAGAKRVRDFSTGRFCARMALQQLGILNTELLPGPGKEPIWPKGITGSISHSKHLAGAIVAPSAEIAAIGIDTETAGGVGKELWNLVFNEREQQLLKAFRAEEQQLFSTLFFSFKESFYKLQYPLTKLFLEFNDVVIDHSPTGFGLSIIHPGCAAILNAEDVKMHWAMTGNEVVSLVYIEANESIQ